MADDPLVPDDPEKDKELFGLFRHLRERVFAGSSEIVSYVMRGIEERLPSAPKESLAASVLVQFTNLVTSWLSPDEAPSPPSQPEAPAADDERREPRSPGDDDE